MVSDSVKRYMTAERAAEIKRRMVEENMILFKVYADYRPALENKYPYYVFGKSAAHAKLKFTEAFPWLRVYKQELCTTEEVDHVLKSYDEVILL